MLHKFNYVDRIWQKINKTGGKHERRNYYNGRHDNMYLVRQEKDKGLLKIHCHAYIHAIEVPNKKLH